MKKHHNISTLIFIVKTTILIHDTEEQNHDNVTGEQMSLFQKCWDKMLSRNYNTGIKSPPLPHSMAQ